MTGNSEISKIIFCVCFGDPIERVGTSGMPLGARNIQPTANFSRPRGTNEEYTLTSFLSNYVYDLDNWVEWWTFISNPSSTEWGNVLIEPSTGERAPSRREEGLKMVLKGDTVEFFHFTDLPFILKRSIKRQVVLEVLQAWKIFLINYEEATKTAPQNSEIKFIFREENPEKYECLRMEILAHLNS